jgi:pSer/pThr/pTyr-binding forkhead associated (FHA) protein
VRQDLDGPLLRVVAGPLEGQQVDLAALRVVIGRSPTCDAVLDDPTVSRQHATLQRAGRDVSVEDLGSTGGTTVNGKPIRGSRVLRHGDLLGFAGVNLRFEAGGDQTEATAAIPTQSAAPQATSPRPAAGHVEYNVAGQQAHMLSNVGRDQYFQHVMMERQSFLREIAATRSRARVMIWGGFILLISGYIGSASVKISFIQGLQSGLQSANGPDDIPSLLGPSVAGVPIGVIALAANLTGIVLLIVGIVLHVVAAARRRGLERSLPTGGLSPGAPWAGQ